MNNPLTLERAVAQYAELTPERRAVVLKDCHAFAYGNYPAQTRELNRALLQAFQEIDGRLAQAPKPPLPTPAETNAFLMWGFGLLAKIGGGLMVIGGGLYLFGVFVVGTGNAFMAGAMANSEVIFWGVCGLVGLVVAVAAYRNWPKNEESEAGETPVKIQNIVNNIYISQSQEGDIKINEK